MRSGIHKRIFKRDGLIGSGPRHKKNARKEMENGDSSSEERPCNKTSNAQKDRHKQNIGRTA
jgi:hypothetical protein